MTVTLSMVPRLTVGLLDSRAECRHCLAIRYRYHSES